MASSLTTLFRLIAIAAIVLNLTELSALQHIGNVQRAAEIYYLVSNVLVALIVHVTLRLSLEDGEASRFWWLYTSVYAYAFFVDILIIFSPLVLAGIRNFRGYTVTAIKGPLYLLHSGFVTLGMLAMIVLPAWVALTGDDPYRRSKSRLWLLCAVPLGFLVITIEILLQLNVDWFNATVSTPLAVAALVGTIGYVVHNDRVIDPFVYIPWSAARAAKTALSNRLLEISGQLASHSDVQGLVDQVADALDCPVCLITNGESRWCSPKSDCLMVPALPILESIEGTAVTNELGTTHPDLRRELARCGVGAVVRFYPHSNIASAWLILGSAFQEKVYTKDAFDAVDRIFDLLSEVILDHLIANFAGSRKMPAGVGLDLEIRPLEVTVREFESELIARAIASCKGNKTAAARMLGLRPNTLHYKIKRYGL